MDFPIFHLDILGNRLLIAIIATLHVVISHALAVGGLPLIALMERRGLKDPRWDAVAKKVLFVFFIITTTVGALTGVGIWFSASLVNPTAIGSLIRVFFWAWFTEWLVFVTEVVLILFYYLTWDRWIDHRKKSHVKLASNLALTSWITMAIIVAILAFMMDTGSWTNQKTFLSGFLNPIYLPQLAFRTALAMCMGGAASLLVVSFLKIESEFKKEVVQMISKWTLFWLPFLAVGSYYYLNAIPNALKANLSVALTTQSFVQWYQSVIYTIITAISLILILMLKGAWNGRLNRGFMILPFIIFIGLMGQFERAREFIRKPYAIGNYLYANGIRKDDYPLLQKEGLLTYAPYTSIRIITDKNRVEAGREVFMIACTRCHTVNGINSVRDRLQDMFGSNPWQADTISAYLGSMHQARTFMPPFPGNAIEKDALADYLVSLQNKPTPPQESP